MRTRLETLGVVVALLLLAVMTLALLKEALLGDATLAQPGISYVQETVVPTELTACPGERLGIRYDVIVHRPTVAAVTQHYVPLGETLARQTPTPTTATTLYFHQDVGRYTLHPVANVPTDLPPGSYNRYVVAQFEGAAITSYRQVVHVVACE